MIKKILVPAILAIVVSLAGSAGFTVMKARTMHAAYLLVQDSLAVLAVDSAAHAEELHEGDSHGEEPLDGASHEDDASGDGANDHAADASGHGMDDPQPLSLDEATTPADSIRALIAEREGRGSKAATPSRSAAPTPAKSAPNNTPSRSAPAKSDSSGATPDAVSSAAALPPVVSKPVPKPAENALPERRLAKIFSNMSARDAAKVLGQMTDGDIRTILSMMGDRQAAAVLTALPAERAAAVSRGTIPPMESVTP